MKNNSIRNNIFNFIKQFFKVSYPKFTIKLYSLRNENIVVRIEEILRTKCCIFISS